jgi:aldose sugar dehydrogenase
MRSHNIGLMAVVLALFGLFIDIPAAGQAQPPEGILEPPNVPMGEITKTTVLEGLEHPWGVVFLPNGNGDLDMLITERPGRLRLVRDGELREEPIGGVPDVLALNQGGLLDVSLHPDFEENNHVYLTYSAGSESENRTTLARGTLDLDSARLEDVQVLFEAEPTKREGQHFGSRILWLEDGTMLVSIGDGGNPPLQIDGTLAREHPQKLDSHLGKVLRLNDDGSVPDDNPFVGRDDAKPEIYSYGHRNIQGMALDPGTGNVWVNEHGPRGGDELNLVQRGENHGWPEATFGRDYRTGERFAEHYVLPGAVAPKVVWRETQAPSGLTFYTGDRFGQWQGSLFSGGLISQEIRRITIDGEQVVKQERLEIGERVRDVVQGPDGYLYVLTDHSDGKLLRIEPGE